MSPSRPSSNLYVLPAPLITAAPGTRARRSRSVRLRWLTWWWRLRLTAREVADALRRFGRPRSRMDASFSFDLEVDHIDDPAPRRSAGPAQVIEFSAARRRPTAR
jgi:hypothetical protein